MAGDAACLFCVVLRMCKEKSIVVHFIITSNGRDWVMTNVVGFVLIYGLGQHTLLGNVSLCWAFGNTLYWVDLMLLAYVGSRATHFTG
jgi:hypothetical protein